MFFSFPQDKKAVLVRETYVWQLMTFLSWHREKEPGDQTVQDRTFLEALGESQIPETFTGNFNLMSLAHLCRSNSTHLSEAKEGLHIYWQKLAFSLMVSWIQGNYGKDWWKSFNSCYGDSMMAARLKMSFINRHRAREHDNEWVNYTSIWGWYYPSAVLIN